MEPIAKNQFFLLYKGEEVFPVPFGVDWKYYLKKGYTTAPKTEEVAVAAEPEPKKRVRK